MRKLVALIIMLLVITNGITYFVTSHNFMWGYKVNTETHKVNKIPSLYIQNIEKSLSEECKFTNALWELLHLTYEDNLQYWENTVRYSKEYQVVDSLKQGDWEDFFYIW